MSISSTKYEKTQVNISLLIAATYLNSDTIFNYMCNVDAGYNHNRKDKQNLLRPFQSKGRLRGTVYGA